MASLMSKRYCVGRCPACQTNIYVEAIIELDGDGHDTAPDPRAEGQVNLTGKITGAQTVKHDCMKKVTR
jgi:hypothetical protein